MSTIAWLVVGVVAGGLARLLVPSRDEIGVFGAVVLALVGATTGGLLTNALVAGGRELSAEGSVGAIVGAIAALVMYRSVMGRRAV
jgi:uncharacterized membrane protein YeaQ/YmgE (transglycosylase-associated protein family)